MNLIRRFKWPIIGVAATVLVVAFLLFRPDKLFIDDVVDESLADAFPVVFEDTPTTTEPSAVTTTTAPPEASGETPSATSTTTTTTTQAPGPVALATGEFFGIDHSAAGTATIYEQDGNHVLRFEDDTDIQNGPDLFVWVLESDSYDSGTPESFIDLGKIKGNVGGQNYALPAEYDPELHQFVLIWCKRFSVPFAAAPLA